MKKQIDLKIVSQMLSAIGLLHVFPNAEKLVEFITPLLSGIPGCISAAVCFSGSNGFCNNKEGLTVNIYPIETVHMTYGHLSMTIRNTRDFAPYEPFVRNLCNSLAITLENARQKKELHEAQELLEERVMERTLDLQESETRYRRITDSLTDYMYTVRLENGTPVETVQTPACERVTGYRPEEFVENSYLWIQMVLPEDVELVRERVQQLLAGEVIPPIEHRIIRKDGEVRWVRDTTILFKDASGNLLSYDGIIQDITERKDAEETLLVQQQQLKELNQSLEERVQSSLAQLRRKDQLLIQQNRLAAMGEMLNNIAHQWRQPLNSMALLLSSIMDAWEFDKLDAEYLEKAISSGNMLLKNMSSTISDFSNFFRPEKEKKMFSALTQINVTVSLLLTSYRNQNVSIEIDAARDSMLIGFPNEYSQVLLNLLSNAKDSILETGRPHGEIIIRLSECEGYGTVTVSDNGGGIPENIIDKIYDPYFSTKESGTGIGLYMSKMILERNMDGEIAVRNSGDGTEFTIKCPLASGG